MLTMVAMPAPTLILLFLVQPSVDIPEETWDFLMDEINAFTELAVLLLLYTM
jgi:hypothetical protein